MFGFGSGVTHEELEEAKAQLSESQAAQLAKFQQWRQEIDEELALLRIRISEVLGVDREQLR